MSAQIQFIDCRLNLIHIPLHLYPHFVQPILQLILPPPPAEGHHPGNGASFASDSRTPASWQAVEPRFVNISLTPVECSVVCSKKSAQELFAPIIKSLEQRSRDEVTVGVEDFVVVQVDGQGLDAGQRVMELTSPLALAGISIFFITTYFSDYILVPLKSRGEVVRALQERGFYFEEHSDAYVTPSHHRNASSSSSSDVPPGTPPPASVDELQKRTSATLKRQNIVPKVNPQIRLIQCAGRSPQDMSSSPGAMEHGLHLGLVKCLVEKPQFLSITLTDTEPASLLLQKESVVHFGDEEVLLGSKEDILIPIMLDLRELPLESTGIVCGVAGKLVGTSIGPLSHGLPPVEMSYLSTARAGTVMVGEADMDRAIAALKM
ncbi:hypothetical protein FGG08_003793 [Glutinoglossum americanum]|uniref:CASTOR ACT domain-containing protein n=1 Tax=Glutinoglossum americanum TaxID=1670608 RepID=A0A9P8I6F1_9PEZI|nr:hypothetical protein FGG08_003793 [Glutinoglossum americanum]